MKRLIAGMRGAQWDHFLEGRRPTQGETFWLLGAALVLPFGWVLLLLRLEPVRLAVRSFLKP